MPKCPEWDRQSPCPLSVARRQGGKPLLKKCQCCPYEQEAIVQAMAGPEYRAEDSQDLE